MNIEQQGDEKSTEVPEYLKRWPGLYMLQNGRIVEALPEDIEVAKGYPNARSKGSIVGGRRITIICRKDTYHVGEQVRVIHVLEVVKPGQQIFVMGPKAVCGEYVDGQETKPEICGEAEVYDGRVIESPGVDYNYDITTYSFDVPGRHEIQWRMGELCSNTLELDVVHP